MAHVTRFQSPSCKSYNPCTHRGSKFLELGHPVGHGRERGGHEEGALHAHLNEVGYDCNALDGLTQTHLVCKDAVDAILVEHLREEGGREGGREGEREEGGKGGHQYTYSCICRGHTGIVATVPVKKVPVSQYNYGLTEVYGVPNYGTFVGLRLYEIYYVKQLINYARISNTLDER